MNFWYTYVIRRDYLPRIVAANPHEMQFIMSRWRSLHFRSPTDSSFTLSVSILIIFTSFCDPNPRARWPHVDPALINPIRGELKTTIVLLAIVERHGGRSIPWASERTCPSKIEWILKVSFLTSLTFLFFAFTFTPCSDNDFGDYLLSVFVSSPMQYRVKTGPRQKYWEMRHHRRKLLLRFTFFTSTSSHFLLFFFFFL